MYEVYHHEDFEKNMKKVFSPEEQRQVKQLERVQLSVNPYVGDSINSPFLREKHLGGKRVYYLIDESHNLVFLITVSTKKTQRIIIKMLKERMPFFEEAIRELIKQRGGFAHALCFQELSLSPGQVSDAFFQWRISLQETQQPLLHSQRYAVSL